jgi:hypothetical protein
MVGSREGLNPHRALNQSNQPQPALTYSQPRCTARPYSRSWIGFSLADRLCREPRQDAGDLNRGPLAPHPDHTFSRCQTRRVRNRPHRISLGPALCPISNSRPPCAFPHIEYSTAHAIIPKQIGCIGHPTPKGTCHADHRCSETPRHLTRLPRHHFWPRAAGRISSSLAI